MGKGICSEGECVNLAHTRGWCKRHYDKIYRESPEAKAEAQRRADQRARELATGLRVCRTCLVEKPMDDFTPHKLAAGGRVSDCRPCRAAAVRKTERASPRRRDRTSELDRRRQRRGWLRKYGITPEDFDAIAERQGGRCAVCRKDKKLVVDHCHASGRVRELLCAHCNTALGMVYEDSSILLGLIRYLERHQVSQPHSERA